MTCAHCQNMDHAPIRTSGELFNVVRTVRQAVADGDIEQIDAGPMKGVVAFENLSEGGPQDDVILYRFRCPRCDQNFVLGAVTWNGTGGSWDKTLPLSTSQTGSFPVGHFRAG